MKETILRGKSMDKGNSPGLMAAHTKDSFMKITLKDKVISIIYSY